MHNNGRRSGAPEGNTLWVLRISYRHKTSGRQSLQARFLLAICVERRRTDSQNLQRMPNDGTKIKQIFATNTTHISGMATPKMGHGPSWSSTNSSRQLQIRCGCSGILHKMDIGKTTSEHHFRSCQKILLAKHNLQVWGAKRANCRQWKAI